MPEKAMAAIINTMSEEAPIIIRLDEYKRGKILIDNYLIDS